MSDDNATKTEVPLDTNDKRRRPPAIAAKCRDCLFFKDGYYPAFRKPCATIGIKHYSRPCSHFFANPFAFMLNEKEHKFVGKIIERYDHALGGIVAWLNQEISTRKKGFFYGQPVMVRMIGDDFLLNYAQAFVVSANSTHVFVQGSKFRCTLLHESIILDKDWVRKRAALLKRKKIRDPKAKEYFTFSRKAAKQKDYVPPSIDDFAKSLSRQGKKETKVIRITHDE